MDFLVTIVRRELRRSADSKALFRRRLVLPIAGGAIIWAGHWYSVARRVTTMGLTLFLTLGFLALIIACLISASVASPAFAKDRENRALGLLLISNVVPWQYVLAHALTYVFHSTVMILSVLPMFILCISLGGVTAGQILQAFAILIATVFLGTSLGLCVSILSPNARHAFSWSFAASLGLFGMLPASVWLLCWHWLPKAQVQWVRDALLPATSPFCAFSLLVQARLPCGGIPYLAGATGLSVVLLIAATIAFPHVAFTSPSVVPGPASGTRFRYRNPVLSKERHVGWIWGWAWYIATIIGCIAVWGYRSGGVEELMLLLSLSSAAVIAVYVLFRCCFVLAGEKDRRTLELLLLSDLSPEEVVFGRLFGGMTAALPWAVTMLAGLAFLGLCEDGVHWSLCLLSFFVVSLFCHAVITLWAALRFNAYVGLAVAAVLFTLSSGIGIAMLRPRLGPEEIAIFLLELLYAAIAWRFIPALLRQVERIGRKSRAR